MRFLCVTALALAAAGCAGTPATTVHGRPVGYWLGRLQNADAAGRRQAVRVLGNAAAADRAVVPALARALDDEDAAVRGEAVLALLKAGPAARDAAPALERRRGDDDPVVRQYAEKALARIRNGS
jgi:HEAT repeat protein